MVKHRWIVLIPLVMLLLPVGARAEGVELAGFAGFRFSDELEGGYDGFSDDYVDYEVDNGPSYGVNLTFPLSKHFMLELLWSRQNTDLYEDWSYGQDVYLGEIDVDYYQIGLVYQWRLARMRPFVVAGVGAAELNPDPPALRDETYFATSWGGGAKFPVGQHFAVQLEGRLFATWLDEDDDRWCCGDCHHGHCWHHDWDDDDDVFVQNEIRLGLVWIF